MKPKHPWPVALLWASACAAPHTAPAPAPAPAPPPAVATASAAAPVLSSAAGSSEAAPAAPPREKIVALAFGDDHACLSFAGGGVACWGDNRDNRTGAGSKHKEVVTPTRVPGVTNAASLVVGYDHTCAALRDGRLTCWGAAHHLVGDDPDPTDGPVVSSKHAHIAQLSGTGGELVARLDDGRVRMWESMTSRMYFMGPGMKAPKSYCDDCVLPGLKDVTQVASGFNTHCAVHADTTLSCWGGNEYGQHGLGSVEPVAEGTLPPRTPRKLRALTNVSEVAVSSHVCARLGDGRVACWGKNDHGQVGDGSIQTRTRPVTLAGIDRVTRLAVAADSSCALRDDGSVWCWGENDEGQLGDGTTADRPTPAPVRGVTDAVALALGHWRACAVRANGEIWCWGWWDLGRKTPKERDETSRRPQKVGW